MPVAVEGNRGPYATLLPQAHQRSGIVLENSSSIGIAHALFKAYHKYVFTAFTLESPTEFENSHPERSTYTIRVIVIASGANATHGCACSYEFFSYA